MRLVIIGGSDAGITAGLRARQLDPTSDVHLIVADDYPNFSICGIPYHVSGEVPDWRSLAHRTKDDLTNAGLQLHLSERAVAVDVDARTVSTVSGNNEAKSIGYDQLIIATGAVPNMPPVAGLDHLGPADGLHPAPHHGRHVRRHPDARSRRPVRSHRRRRVHRPRDGRSAPPPRPASHRRRTTRPGPAAHPRSAARGADPRRTGTQRRHRRLQHGRRSCGEVRNTTARPHRDPGARRHR